MADIKDQLIKDSYNYVLQSDLSTGVVYRIGGSIPVNPIFSSGLTINDSFVYSGAGEQNGYALLTDGTGYAYWGPVSGASPSSGVTSISVGNGLSASSSTGAVTIVFTGSTSVSGDYLPLSGGTVTGNTIFQSGLTATTISATTYYNLPVTADTFVTGFTLSSNTITLSQNRNDAYSSFTISLSAYTGSSLSIGGGGGQLFYLNLSQSQGSNRLLSTTGSTASQQTTGVTINNGVTGSIASFQSQPLNITLLPGGIWSFYLHSYKQNTNASFDIFVEVYKRTSGGTQTLLFSTDPTPVTTNSPNPSMQLSDSYFSGTTLLVSDSIVATVRATNTGNQSHTITLVTEGSTHYSYVVSTIPTQQGLTCDTLSGCTIIQTIQTDLTNKLDKSGGTISGGLVVNSGLTANTISATTYQNLPVSGVTGGTGISASTSGGLVTIANTAPDQTVLITGGTNIQITGTYPNFGVNFTGTTGGGPTLVASNTCLIPADGNPYIGSNSVGWGYFQWDSRYEDPIKQRNVTNGIPLPKDVNENGIIRVCGIAYCDASAPEHDILGVILSYFICGDLKVNLISQSGYTYQGDGTVCFNLESTYTGRDTLVSCETFLILGFSSSLSDATQIKISYTIKIE